MNTSAKEQVNVALEPQSISSFNLLKGQLSSIDHLCFGEDVGYIKSNGIDILSTGVDFVKKDGNFNLVFFGPMGVQAVVETPEPKFGGVKIEHFQSSDVQSLETFVEITVIPL
jgi:hypothetical protein